MIIPVWRWFMYVPHHAAHTTCENCREICEWWCNAGDYIIIWLTCIVLLISLLLVIALIINIYKGDDF